MFRSEVDLVEVMEDAMDRVEHRAIGIVLTAAVLVHQVEGRSVCKGLAAEFITGIAGPVQALGVRLGAQYAKEQHVHVHVHVSAYAQPTRPGNF